MPIDTRLRNTVSESTSVLTIFVTCCSRVTASPIALFSRKSTEKLRQVSSVQVMERTYYILEVEGGLGNLEVAIRSPGCRVPHEVENLNAC